MKIVVMTVGGQSFESSEITYEDILEESGGDKHAASQMYDEIQHMVSHFSTMTYLAVEKDGRKRYFNPANILWTMLADPLTEFDD